MLQNILRNTLASIVYLLVTSCSSKVPFVIIKIIKALHDLCRTFDLIYIQFRMALIYKPTTWKIIKNCFTIYKPLLKELSIIE